MQRILIGGLLLVVLGLLGGGVALGGPPLPPAMGKGLLPPAQLPCDWTVVDSPNSPYYTDWLLDVAAITPDDVWAVGFSGAGSVGNSQALTLHWDGASWQLVATPGLEAELLAVSAVNTADVWAVGVCFEGSAPRTPCMVHWDGSQWQQSAPLPGWLDWHSRLNDVLALAANDVWAVGSSLNGSALIVHWDGMQWSRIPVPVDGTLRSIAAGAPDDMWAVGLSSTSHSMTLHWDGLAWTEGPISAPPQEQGLFQVVAGGRGDAWAMGYYPSQYGPAPWIWHWDGQAWQPSLVLGQGNIGMAARAPNDVWVVGTTSNRELLSWHWDGSTWTESSSSLTLPVGYWIVALAALPNDELWALGYGGRTLTVHYGGACPPTPTVTGTPPTATSTRTPTGIATNTTATATGTMHPGHFEDVPPDHPFYFYIECLDTRNIISGYACGGPGEPCRPEQVPYFRPYASVMRGQVAKIVAVAAGLSAPVPSAQQTFQDVPSSNPFWLWIEQLAAQGAISGYSCGGNCCFETCIPPGNRPYFRPYTLVNRGQLAKIAVRAAGFSDPIPSTQQTFEDVPLTHPFWLWVEQAAVRQVIGGYACGGGAGGPCVPPDNRPYYRPGNAVTRAQTAKIVANTFFPNCQAVTPTPTPGLPTVTPTPGTRK